MDTIPFRKSKTNRIGMEITNIEVNDALPITLINTTTTSTKDLTGTVMVTTIQDIIDPRLSGVHSFV